MERYDAVIIGAGPDGLIAAHMLASAGLKTIVLDRADAVGGSARTREFHPGFMASTAADDLAALPPRIFRELNLPRHGAVFMPMPASTCLSAGGTTLIYRDAPRMARIAGKSGPALVELTREINHSRAAIAGRIGDVTRAPRLRLPWAKAQRRPWPGETWAGASLAEALEARLNDSEIIMHLAAQILSGAAASPFLMGSALHLLRGIDGSGLVRGGLSSLAGALEKAARSAGAEIRLSAEVTNVQIAKGRAGAAVLASGEEISARTILSTLDLKATFLSLVAWNDLARDVTKRLAQFRMAGSTARVLFALDLPPAFGFAAKAHEAALGPIHIADSLNSLTKIHDNWRAGILSEQLPVTLRVPSLTDPSLAPPGKAVMTATIGGVPTALFDGDWTAEKREKVTKIAIAAAERAAPGIQKLVIASRTIIAKDFENELGWTAGDFEGGELAPDQALGFRPFADWQDGRTALKGLYLGGPSSTASPFYLGAGGAHAAASIIADITKRRPA